MGNRKIPVGIGILCVALAISIIPAVGEGTDVQDRCRECHGDARKMQELGYPHFFVTRQEVEQQTGMSATCRDCHLGDTSSRDKDQAHRGMGRLLLVRKKGLHAEIADRRLPLEIAGNPVPRLKYLVEKGGRNVVDPSVNTFLYQDKRVDTLSQDFTFMEKTCGKCHPLEFAEFRKSAMGSNGKQRRYKGWADKEHGPHNCGVWFGDNYSSIAAILRSLSPGRQAPSTSVPAIPVMSVVWIATITRQIGQVTTRKRGCIPLTKRLNR